MKKKIITFAILGILLIIIGGSGAAVYFQKANNQVLIKTNETYVAKKEANTQVLELTVRGNTRFNFYSSDDEKFHLNSELYSLNKKRNAAWTTEEADGKTKVDVTYTESGPAEPNISFNFWEGRYQYVNISIPKTYTTIVVKSQAADSLSFYSLTTKDLSVDSPNSSVNLQDMRVASLAISGQKKYIHATSIMASDKVTVTNQQGDIALSDIKTNTLRTQNETHAINLSDIIADTEINSEHGDIELSNIKGKNVAKSSTGTIKWHQKTLIADSKLSSTNGNVYVLLDELQKNLVIRTSSTHGSVKLFDEEKSTFNTGANGPTLSVETGAGTIIVTDDEYDYDTDDEYF